MNTTMTTTGNKTPRTNRIITTFFVGLTALILGLLIGAAAAETGSMPNLVRKAHPATDPISSTAPGNLKSGGIAQWNPFQEMRDMQAQVDQSFDRIFDRLRSSPQFIGFNDYPGYSLALDVRDLKDRYEVQADLPDVKPSDVHVSLKNGQTLDVEVNRKEAQTSEQKNAATSVTELSQYDQMVQLPTPVKADQMKIQREGHELIITIPKAA